MQKVITINLNGNAYQVDEGGYSALLTYLDGAQRQLLDNPDRAEIIADLEQAIADKCRGFLGPHKTVVTGSEVDQIIREMGPVDATGGAGAGAGAGASAGADADAAGSKASSGGGAPHSAPRRLYVIHEGAMLGGVCTGLAAYLHIDVTIIRIAFLLLALVTRGGFALVYLVLAFVIPPADTSEQRAAAHGQPFNAQELIDQAKKQYASFTSGSGWGASWRQDRRAWRQQRRAARWQARWGWNGGWGTPPPTVSPGTYGTYGSRMITGAMVPILSLISVLLFWACAFAVYSLVTTGQVLGQTLPDDVPFWVGIVVVVCAYHVVAWPLHFARRRAAYYSFGGTHYGMLAAWDGMLSLTFGIFVVWIAYRYIPEIREIIRTIPDVLRSVGVNVS